jgi:hypothetical protein
MRLRTRLREARIARTPAERTRRLPISANLGVFPFPEVLGCIAEFTATAIALAYHRIDVADYAAGSPTRG